MAEEKVEIKDELYNRVKEFSKKEGITINVILQYIWHKILSIYGNSKQTIVGTTVSGRSIEGIANIEEVVGLCINTLPLIVNHGSGEEKVKDKIKKIQEDINELNVRSNVSLGKLQRGGERLFETLFIYENYPEPTSEGEDKMKIKFKESIEKIDYPMGVTAYEGGESIEIKIEYAGELFRREGIVEIRRMMEKILGEIVDNDEILEREIEYLGRGRI